MGTTLYNGDSINLTTGVVTRSTRTTDEHQNLALRDRLNIRATHDLNRNNLDAFAYALRHLNTYNR